LSQALQHLLFCSAADFMVADETTLFVIYGTTMSRTYEICVCLSMEEAVPETEWPFWKRALVASVEYPTAVIDTGINFADEDLTDTGDSEADESADIDEVDVYEPEDGKMTFTLNKDRQIGLFYGLNNYLTDLDKAIYLATRPLNKRFTLTRSGVDREPEVDEWQEFTYSELEAKYGPEASNLPNVLSV